MLCNSVEKNYIYIVFYVLIVVQYYAINGKMVNCGVWDTWLHYFMIKYAMSVTNDHIIL